MRSLLPYFVIVIVLSSLGCANEVRSVDVEAERTALLEANRAWAAAAAAGDVARIISFWADDAISYFPGAPVAQGKEAIGELVRRNRSQPGFSLSWELAEAVVAHSGDLAYTSGTIMVSVENAEGTPVTRRGNYVGIWKKQADGSWKCAVAINTLGPPSA